LKASAIRVQVRIVHLKLISSLTFLVVLVASLTLVGPSLARDEKLPPAGQKAPSTEGAALPKSYPQFMDFLWNKIPETVDRNRSFQVLVGGSLVFSVLSLLLFSQWWGRKRDRRGLDGKLRELQLRTSAHEEDFNHRVQELAAKSKSKISRTSTFFMRLQRLLKADTKSEFFKCFSEACVNGFSVDRCAFWLMDRKSGTLSPLVFGITDRDEQGAGGKVKEIRSPAANGLTVRPGDGNIIGFVAANGGAMTNRSKDTAHAHLFDKNNPINRQDPVKTEVACAVTSVDTVTQEETFVGVIALGMFSEGEAWSASESHLLSAFATMTGSAFARADLLELTAAELASTQEQSMLEREQRKKIRGVLDQVVSSNLAEQLLSNPEALNFKGEMVQASVFFSDIVGFTTYCENRSPQEVVSILNEYLGAMTDIIQAHGGTLDKFVGDEIVAHWGALPRSEDHAIRSVQAAFDMKLCVEALQARWKAEGREPFSIGMGISTGPMLFGCIGSSKKLDFTVMGDTVNLGARLEALTRKYPYDLIISENTYLAAKDHMEAELLGQVSVKGKDEKVRVYGVSKVAAP